jgi:hypothetical protein
MQACQIRVFTLGPLGPLGFLRLALHPARFLLALLHLLRLLAVALGECCFAWSSDGALLSGGRSSTVYLKMEAALKKKMTEGADWGMRSSQTRQRKYKIA